MPDRKMNPTELAKALRGKLPRYYRSDDKSEDVVVQSSELSLAIDYLEGMD